MGTGLPGLGTFSAAAVELIAAGTGDRGVAERLRERTASGLAVLAATLAASRGRIGIVTGFYVPDAPCPAPETDGPLATAVLADVLAGIGCEVDVITDRFCATALQAFFESCDAKIERLVIVESVDRTAPASPGGTWNVDVADGGPEAGDSADVVRTSRAAAARLVCERRVEPAEWLARYDALVAIERAGPCRDVRSAGAGPQSDGRGRHVNIRGECIDAWCEDLGRLFDAARERGIFTAGIGDGGNEIGFGCLHAEGISCDWLRHWSGPLCQTVTDCLIASDVSHWGGLALAVAVAMQAACVEILQQWPAPRHAAVLRQAARRRLLVDGITRRYEPTIDGLPLCTHLSTWERLTQLAQTQRR